MQAKRAFVFSGLRSRRALAALECARLTASEAKVPANVNLSSLKPGMIVRPALGPRQPDPSQAYTIQDVQQSKTGQSTIRFQSEGPTLLEVGGKASEPSKTPPTKEAEKK